MACMTKNKSNRDMIGGLRSQFLCSGNVALGFFNAETISPVEIGNVRKLLTVFVVPKVPA